MRIVIDSMQDNVARIFAYTDGGREIYQRNRDISQDRARAQRNHSKLEDEVLKTERLWVKGQPKYTEAD